MGKNLFFTLLILYVEQNFFFNILEKRLKKFKCFLEKFYFIKINYKKGQTYFRQIKSEKTLKLSLTFKVIEHFTIKQKLKITIKFVNYIEKMFRPNIYRNQSIINQLLTINKTKINRNTIKVLNSLHLC